jgi:GNAT superfamily N-acetyltransferase
MRVASFEKGASQAPVIGVRRDDHIVQSSAELAQQASSSVSTAPDSAPRLRTSLDFEDVEREPRLSERLWGIDWRRILPQTLVGDITANLVDAEVAREFIEAHYAEIAPMDPTAGWFVEGWNSAKQRYARHVADCFGYYHRGRVVGIYVGNPMDWSTYYLRSTGVLPAYRGKGLTWRFMELLLGELERAGVERVEGETSPANYAIYKCLMRLGFCVSGTVLSDRWGALTRLTRYFDPKAERVFGEKFCAIAPPRAADADRRSRCASAPSEP